MASEGSGYEIRVPEVAEVETLLLNSGTFAGLPDPSTKVLE